MEGEGGWGMSTLNVSTGEAGANEINSSWDGMFDTSGSEYIFHRNDVFYAFLGAYLLVALLAVFGNLLVILVVQCDRQVESKTNFLLGQLAVADLCVGVFCVMQSFMSYLNNWLLGLFLCQMCLYVQALSYVASVLIMVAVCVERYVAIMQPFHTRTLLTTYRLRLVVVVVWAVSAAYASPRLFFAHVTSQDVPHSSVPDTFCHLDTSRYNPDAFDMANLVLLYVLPLIAMAAMYSRMCLELWRSGQRVPAGNVHAGQPRPLAPCVSNNIGGGVAAQGTSATVAQKSEEDHSPVGNGKSTITTSTSLLHLVGNSGSLLDRGPRPLSSSLEAALGESSCCSYSDELRSSQSGGHVSPIRPPLRRITSLPPQRRRSVCCRDPLRPLDTSPRPRRRQQRTLSHYFERRHSRHHVPSFLMQPPPKPIVTPQPRAPCRPDPTPGPLVARRRVVLMLMLVVLFFLLCNLPYHARKMWQARLRSQPPTTYTPTSSNSLYSKLFTPITFLIMYLNSALNPVLYVTMSRTFRRAMLRRLRLCTKGCHIFCRCCRKERKPIPSPLIGRTSSTRHGGGGGGSTFRATNVVLAKATDTQHNGNTRGALLVTGV